MLYAHSLSDHFFVEEFVHYARRKKRTGEYWIQRITFAAETNAACMARQTHTQRDSVKPSITIPRSLSGGEGNDTF